MVRILQVFGRLNVNGTESLIMNVFRHLNREEIMFDFLVSELTDSPIEREARMLGAEIHTFSPRNKGLKKHVKSLHKFFQENSHKYKGIHINGNSFSFMMPLIIAKKYGVPSIIAHCHNYSTSGLHNKILHQLNKLRIHKISNVYLACSEEARVYGYKGTPAYEKAIIISNGIELEKFRFNPEIRERVRKELNLRDEFIIGHVGGLREAKNHPFMLKILSEVLKERPNAMLVFVGDGPLKEDIVKKTHEMGLENNVLFLGVREDVADLLQAFDVFLFPSLYEGFGISLIEAQAAGLQTIASRNIPQNTNVTPLIHYLSLDDGANKWANHILNLPQNDRNTFYEGLTKYDISKTCKALADIYLGPQE